MTSNPFGSSSPQIAPSILSADFSRLAAEIEDVDRGGADFLHLDVMDGHFVPNISFGPAVTAAARRVTKAFLDVHLMIDEPLRYAKAFIDAGADALTFHVETVKDPAAAAKELRGLGCKHVGITLKPGTAIEAVYSALGDVDHVLIMSVEPGFSGQKFMPEMLKKAVEVKKRMRAEQRLEIDGGIHDQTIARAAEAGIDWFVVGSAVFDQKDRGGAIRKLRNLLK